MRATLLVLTIAMLASACSTKQVQVQPAASLRIISSTIALDIHGKDVDPAVVDWLERYLKAKLIAAGFDINRNATKGLRLQVDVYAFNPGNQGLRLTVGLGAGRGGLLYTARYVDRDGHVLAQMEGQEYFTGTELDFNHEYGHFTTVGGAETVKSVLVQEAAKHIVELASGEKK